MKPYTKVLINVIKQGIDYMTNEQAWNYAIGMIKVDGLEPTEDFKQYIEKEKRGELTTEDLKRYLDKKYKMKNQNDIEQILLETDECAETNPDRLIHGEVFGMLRQQINEKRGQFSDQD